MGSDDQILEAISKLKLRDSNQGESAKVDSKTVEQWCRSLVLYRTEEIKARIDAIYKSKLLDALDGTMESSNGNNSADGKDALQAELETLREEIASVSEMVVENDLRKPIMTSVERSSRNKTRSHRDWVEYVCVHAAFASSPIY